MKIGEQRLLVEPVNRQDDDMVDALLLVGS